MIRVKLIATVLFSFLLTLSIVQAETTEVAGFIYNLSMGDILFQKSTVAFVSVIPGPIDHSGIYNGSGQTIDSVFQGVVCQPIKYLYEPYGKPHYFRGAARVNAANNDQKQGAADFNSKEVGKPYGFPWSPHYWNDGNETWYCSELVYKAYESQGIELADVFEPFTPLLPFWILPTELYNSDEVTILTPVIDHPNSVYGFVFENENWTAYLNIGGLSGKKLTIGLSWGIPIYNDLTLTVKDPEGTIYDSTSNAPGFTYKGPWPSVMTFDNPIDGQWEVTIRGESLTIDTDPLYALEFQEFALITQVKDTDTPGDNVGGINFTDATLNYISTCNPENGLEVVMKGTEANVSAGDAIINITNATVQATDAFLTALAIPNHKMWVTMDTKPGSGFAGKVGDVSRVDGSLAHTQLGQIMFDADIQLKMDTFAQSQSLLDGLINDWVDSVSGNSAVVPEFYVRVWISGESVTANGTGCKLFITNSSLKVESNVDAVWLNQGTGYEQQLADFKTDLENGLADLAAQAAIKINNKSDATYADLRRAHASIALAQWYKDNNREDSVLSSLIDSNDLTGLNISFDQNYFESQAWQHLWTFYHHGDYWYKLYGGVELTNLQTSTSGGITNATQQALDNASTASYVKEGATYYYSTLMEPERANLEPLALGFNTLNPEPGNTVNISVAIQNTGKVNATNFTVSFYQSFTHDDGYVVTDSIGESPVSFIATDDIELVSVLWNASAPLGIYNITAVVDYYGTVEESNDLNNKVSELIRVYTDYPTATITSPASNSYSCGVTPFTGSGTDYQDGPLNESSLLWNSSIDGYLGSGSSLSVNLSLGTHVISLTANDSRGFTHTDTIISNIVTCTNPESVIKSPLSNITYVEGEMIYFIGEASDEEDGNIPSASLTWNSSLNGALGAGSSFSLKTLAVGDHVITLRAEDRTNLVSLTTTNITVEEGTPSVSILSPSDSAIFTHKAILNLSGNASDPQDGNLSSSIIWASSVDGNLGTGNVISTGLSVGAHTITATIIDSHGLTSSSQVGIEIRPPQYPVASIIFPRNTQQFTHGHNISFEATYSDFEDAIIPNSSLVWNSSINGVIGYGTAFTGFNFSMGAHMVSFSATDSDNLTSIARLNITINPAPPVPVIQSPNGGDIFAQIEHVVFSGSAKDYEDGNLSGSSLNWTSSKDGTLGTGTFLNLTNLTAGTHTITLNAMDSSGLVGADSLFIIVVGQSQTLLNRFIDNALSKNITFTSAENRTEYISLPKLSNVSYAAINIRGYP